MSLLAHVLDAVERRRSNRKLASIPGWIDTGGLLPLLECKVRNYSVGGAKLELSDAAVLLPATFVLRISTAAGTGTGVDCHVLWRRGSFIGVRFLKQQPLPSTDV